MLMDNFSSTAGSPSSESPLSSTLLSSLKIQGFIWFNTTNWFTLQDYKGRVNMAVLKRFNEEGLSFAYPTSTVFLAK